MQANALVEAFSSEQEEEKAKADMRERSTARDEALRYVMYQYLEHVNSALTKNALSAGA